MGSCYLRWARGVVNWETLDAVTFAVWVAHASRVLASASRDRELFKCIAHCLIAARKDRFGAPPLQRMRSNGQAFKPAREPRALPDSGRYSIDKRADLANVHK